MILTVLEIGEIGTATVKKSNKSVKPIPLSFEICLSFWPLFILFLYIILFDIRGCSSQSLSSKNNHKPTIDIPSIV